MKKFILLLFSFSAVTFSCTKNTIDVKIDDLAGTWLLKQYAGGIAPLIYKPKDTIVISFTPFGEYTSTVNDSITAERRYKITKAGDPNYYFSNTLINFSPLEGEKTTYGIILRNDSLFLDEGCCDRYTYFYTRKN